mmetsp:Transcript_87639/g.203869  ORF Transcript_87639/g.203869 Transcript_87639/m.203869 type:complete len:291 (+) Transcript_87639:73-945(+)
MQLGQHLGPAMESIICRFGHFCCRYVPCCNAPCELAGPSDAPEVGLAPGKPFDQESAVLENLLHQGERAAAHLDEADAGLAPAKDVDQESAVLENLLRQGEMVIMREALGPSTEDIWPVGPVDSDGPLDDDLANIPPPWASPQRTASFSSRACCSPRCSPRALTESLPLTSEPYQPTWTVWPPAAVRHHGALSQEREQLAALEANLEHLRSAVEACEGLGMADAESSPRAALHLANTADAGESSDEGARVFTGGQCHYHDHRSLKGPSWGCSSSLPCHSPGGLGFAYLDP